MHGDRVSLLPFEGNLERSFAADYLRGREPRWALGCKRVEGSKGPTMEAARRHIDCAAGTCRRAHGGVVSSRFQVARLRVTGWDRAAMGFARPRNGHGEIDEPGMAS